MQEVLPAVKQTGVELTEDVSANDGLIVISFAREVHINAKWVEKGKAIDAIRFLEPEPHLLRSSSVSGQVLSKISFFKIERVCPIGVANDL